ncbi:hypothetical protein D3C86_1927340 [compost metagenome]
MLNYGYHIFAELYDCRVCISKQQVSRTVILGKDRWVNGLSHGDTKTLRLFHRN